MPITRSITRSITKTIARPITGRNRRAFNYGELLPVIGSAPTVTIGVANAAATLTGTSVTRSDPKIRYIGGTVEDAGPSYPLNQFTAVNNLTFTDGSRSGAISSVEFVLNCQEFEFRAHGNNSDFRLLIDGERTGLNTSLPSAGSLHWCKVSFSSKAERHIRIDGSVSQLRFGGLTLDSSGTIENLPALTGQSLVFLGDSFIEGSGVSDKHQSLGGIAAQRLGVDDYTISGFGATGYITTFYPGFGSTRDDIEGRFQEDALDYNPDYIIIAAGLNDGTSYTEAAFTAAVDNVLNAAVAANIPVILVGPWNPNSPTPRGGNLALIAGDLQAAAAARSNVYYFDPDLVEYTKSDATHPDEAGHIVLGDWLAQQIAENVS